MFLNTFNYFPSNYFYHLAKLLLLLNVSTKWQTIKILLDFFEFFWYCDAGHVTSNHRKKLIKTDFFHKKEKINLR